MFPGAAPTHTSSTGSGWLGQEPEGLSDSWGPQVWSSSQGPSHPAIPECTEAPEGRDLPRTRASLHVVKGADVRLPRPLPRAGSPPPHTTSALIHPRLAAWMCTFPGSAITEDHKLNGLNSRNVLSHLSGGWKSEIEMSAEPVPSEGCEGRICPRSLSFTLSVKKA